VKVVDVVSGKVTASISLRPHPSGLALSADGNRLFVTCAAAESEVCLASAGQRSGAAPAAGDLLAAFRHGPMSNVTEVVFCAGKPNLTDGHWYANFGYYAHDPARKAWREGTKLCRLNLSTGKVVTFLEDARGGVRDPQVHYDGELLAL
jgi:hypothetical protein